MKADKKPTKQEVINDMLACSDNSEEKEVLAVEKQLIDDREKLKFARYPMLKANVHGNLYQG